MQGTISWGCPGYDKGDTCAPAAWVPFAGTAMIWFAQPVVGYAMYFPIAMATLLFAWSHADYQQQPQLLMYHILGAALFNSTVAAGLTLIGAGTAMVFGMWGGAGLLVALCLSQVRS
jgi:hypothetical protein